MYTINFENPIFTKDIDYPVKIDNIYLGDYCPNYQIHDTEDGYYFIIEDRSDVYVLIQQISGMLSKGLDFTKRKYTPADDETYDIDRCIRFMSILSQIQYEIKNKDLYNI